MLSHKTTYLPAAFLLSAGLAGGCVATTAKKAPILEPISVPTFVKTEPIAFKRIVLKVPRNRPIGSVGVGLACLKSSDYMVSGGRYSLESESFNDVFREELIKANYEVVGDPDKLFGDPDLNKAKYFIAGLINDIEVNACYPWVGTGNLSTSSAFVYMRVEWQIYDTLRRRVVAEISTEGSSETREPVAGGSSIAIDSAFGSRRGCNFLRSPVKRGICRDFT